jgi:gas vesicle protein GvpO
MTTLEQSHLAVEGIEHVVDRLRYQFRAVTGFDAIRIASLKPADNAWAGRVEVVELHRTPDTQDLVGLYEVEMDHDGNLLAWDRMCLRVKGEPTRLEDVSG